MNFVEFWVRRPAFTLVMTLCVIALGWVSFTRIPRAEDPSLRIPVFNVIVVSPGWNPRDLEELVARPVEDAVKELEDLKKLQTTIRDGLVVVTVEFEYGTDPDRKHDDVLRQVNAMRDRLPGGVARLEVKKVQTINVALMQVALVSETAGYDALADQADLLMRRLESVSGVRKAERWAYPEKQVDIVLDPVRLSQAGIPVGMVVAAVGGDAQTVAGGSAELGARRFTIKTTGGYESLDEIGRTTVGGGSAGVVRLRDVAEVSWGYAELEHIGRFRGERAVFVTAMPQKGVNSLALRDQLSERLDSFAGQLPAGIRLERGFDQAANVEARLGRLEHDFLIAFGLVLLTVLPLGLRASVLVMLSIPLSLALGLTLLMQSGHSLNQLSIVGLVIALGLLVDDSIVVVENIARLRREGRSAAEAAVVGTRQIAVAVVGTTATLLFAFLPLLLLPGGPGQFIRGLPLAVVYTVASSLVISMTVMPFLAGRFLGGSGHADEGNFLLRAIEKGIQVTYRPFLHRAMAHPWWTLALTGATFAGSLLLVPKIGFSLFPKAGTPQFAVRVHGGEGNSVAATDAIVRQVEGILAATPEIDWWFANVGRGNPQIYYNEIPEEQSARIGDVFCSLKQWDPVRSPAVLEGLRRRFESIPGARVLLKEFENGPPIEAPIAIRVFGEDLARLTELAAGVEQILRSTAGTESVDNPMRVPRTDLRVRLDRAKAGLMGVSEAEVDRATRLAFAGLEAGRVRDADGDEYGIVLSLGRGDRATLTNWAKAWVPGAGGRQVPLREVATLEMESAPPLIQRYNRERSVTLTSFVVAGENTDRVTRTVVDKVEAMKWPKGYRYGLGGEVESRNESFAGLGTAVVLAMFGILAVLVLEFGDFRGTIVVASVIPLGVVGGLVALLATGYTLSFTASIGFIALIGIEIKNSILLVDFTNQLRAEGVPLREAIERAGEVRFLPVVLTTLTAVGALMPLATSRSAMYSPLAWVIIGGLLSSLLLSRVVTPVLYSLLPPRGR
jgi:multidrug efflux pump subunit AcrB